MCLMSLELEPNTPNAHFRLQDQGTVQHVFTPLPRQAVSGVQLPGGRARRGSGLRGDTEVWPSPRQGPGCWAGASVATYDVLRSVGGFSFSPSSIGKHRKHPGNATAPSRERPQVPGTNDFKDFVLEMQKTITDLREQVSVPAHPASQTAFLLPRPCRGEICSSSLEPSVWVALLWWPVPGPATWGCSPVSQWLGSSLWAAGAIVEGTGSPEWPQRS